MFQLPQPGDDYHIQVMAMLDEKSKGKEVTISAPAPERGGKVVDIMEALKHSMERIPAKRKPAAAAAVKKKEILLTRKELNPISLIPLLQHRC
jgi:non-homologous end joining protein Ku